MNNIYPNIQRKLISKPNTNDIITFSCYVRIKCNKEWYELLVSGTVTLDTKDTDKQLFNEFVKFNKFCISVLHCSTNYSKTFIKNNPDKIRKSNLQISEKNRTYIRNIHKNNLLTRSL